MTNNTGVIIGVSVVVVGIIIAIVVVTKKAPVTPLMGYNPNLYPPGYIPPNSVNSLYAQQNSTEKAALYTAGASVLNNVMDTFFSPKSGSSSGSSGSSSTTPVASTGTSNYNDYSYNPSSPDDQWS